MCRYLEDRSATIREAVDILQHVSFRKLAKSTVDSATKRAGQGERGVGVTEGGGGWDQAEPVKLFHEPWRRRQRKKRKIQASRRVGVSSRDLKNRFHLMGLAFPRCNWGRPEVSGVCVREREADGMSASYN